MAVVTGGGTGIGRAISLRLAQAGIRVIATYLTHPADELLADVERIGGRCEATKLDATDSKEVTAFFERTASATAGRLDFLVNNAGGLLARVPIADMTDSHWHNVIDTNLSSALYCMRDAVKYMSAGARIVNVSSLAARTGGGEGASAYAAAKAGLEGLTRAAAKEWAPRGILVNAVAPGFITGTPFHAKFTPTAAQDAAIAGIPLGRPGTPEDVAGAVMYLLSPESAFCTGTTLEVTGGSY